MLKRLYIENIAIIDKLEIEFEKGLSILTGETGAGKSIIIDSLSLLLGTKAKKDIIRTNSTKALVSAVFDIEKESTVNFINSRGIELEDGQLIVSREIYSNGKSVCKINGQFVTLSSLREITTHIFEIHGQNETHLLNDKKIQLMYIDRFCGKDVEDLKREYKKLFNEYQEKGKMLRELIENEEEKERRLDILNYQISEIESVSPRVGEDIELEKKREIVQNFSKLKYNTEKIMHIINKNLMEYLEVCIKLANENAKFDQDFNQLAERLNSVYYEIEDILFAISKKFDSYTVDEHEIDKIIDRLDKINRLKKKYGGSIEQVLKFKEELIRQKIAIEKNSEIVEELKVNLSKIGERLLFLANEISNLRKDAAREFEKKVLEVLEQLEMKNVNFRVSFMQSDLYEEGIDEVEFLISTNVGQELKSLSSIASGGELSRIMLAIKSIMAEKDDILLLIFDEIDSGLSGVAATKLARLLKDLSKKHQVICITHLPQVAAAADNHFYVYKEVKDNSTVSNAKRLDENESLKEIARMFSGENITESSILHAKQLKAQFV
ncbi:DNA repair protein RecN [Caldicellulosiruptor naganoensis]|uniref:DNA repair protein RecN n=1 Tax=Caldicellulosiruptor naganoensis TaxID=29324 RepID=A0ABY7BDF1_9FIRM|nr:DNA repair protein RecN [Caldicellulosiruptor naganoensis]WAM30629.1 DNA repair protein RecN [Caldicellulosiruptor naganoensis]